MLEPLRLTPVMRQYLWGGRRLESLLGKRLGDGDHFAESWEIVDHGEDQSVVTDGPLAGTSLHQLVIHHGEELLGVDHPARQFPLLFKYLDAHRDLSVQVHPNDRQAADQDPPDLGKTEAWYVVHAEPGAALYAGLKSGVDRPALEDHIRRGTVEQCLRRIEPAVGDAVLIPAGTVHAIGSGLVIAEIQQSSDTTFRLFDWNRLGLDGQPRTLHVEQALGVIEFNGQPTSLPAQPQAVGPHTMRLVTCDKFVMDRWQFSGSVELETMNRCWILSVLKGSIAVIGLNTELTQGQTALIPARCGNVAFDSNGDAMVLAMSTGCE